jgi:ABC-type Mn2+/Zn2+ transport system ATPase subunit
VIHKLSLTGFGKFRRADFELGGVTLVFGPNEAGKTTFFDGLFQALCRPSEAKKAGKDLKARYGADRSAQATLSRELPVTDDEFMNLYAIRAGDLQFELGKGAEWLDRLKSRLFHGGIDPAMLIAEFKNRSSDSRTFLHNKELEKAREAADKARSELDAKRRDREAVLSREKSLAETEAALEETRKAIQAITAEIADAEKRSGEQDRIGLRRKWNGHLAKLEEWMALRAEAEALEPYRDDRREEFDRLLEASRQAESALQSDSGKRDLQAKLIAETKAEVRALRDQKDAVSPRSTLAKRLAEEAGALLSGKAPKPGLPLWSSAGVAVLVLAGAAAAVLLWGWGGAVAGIACLAASCVVALLGLRARKDAMRNGMAAKLTRCKDQWNLGSAAIGALPGMDVSGLATVEGFMQAMETASRERDALEAREAEAARRLESQKDGLESLESSLAGRKDALENARRAEREWLAAHRAETMNEYLAKVARCAQVRAGLPRRRAELEELAEGMDLEGFHREVRRKLQGLDEEGVPERGLDEASLQRLRKRRQDLQLRRETEERREREWIAKREGLAGEIRGAFGNLAGEIVACEDRLSTLEEGIRKQETDKQAAALALDIFKEVGNGADLLLAGLSREMESMLGNILPAGRTVALLGLDKEQIQVQDAAGGARSLEHLSTGTKHAMVLAAKLALALKHREGGTGILVLDEPFLAMDDERETKALELLRDFHDRHGWQIILMTKETGLKNKVLELFTAPKLVDLSLFR